MDKIWDRNPSKSEVIGRCAWMKQTNDHAEPTKVERSKSELSYIKKRTGLKSDLIFHK